MSQAPRARLSLIVAMDRNGLIGAGGDLPWRLPADLQHFRRTTWGHPILMGRVTHESIGRPLPGRDNLVLSRRADYRADGCQTYTDLDRVLSARADAGEIFVIGGAELYRLALPLAERLYLTRIDAEFEGDTWFPAWNPAEWRLLDSQHRPADSANPWPLKFEIYQRVQPETP